ncbi:MAG TPA: chloride channel protein [Bacteroidetes bacterium]|nr:chloride channel protein [Bacteroidota bacterium]
MIGILLSILFIKFVLRKQVRQGISNVLYSISKRSGKLNRHNMYSSVVTSALTVGFGGSVGLEGPTISTGAAFGSFASRIMGLDFKLRSLMMACACAGTMAAIFKAPIAAIVFAVEVFMIDLTTFSLMPLLFASVFAVLTSWFFLGNDVLYPFTVVETFALGDLPFYILLGIVCGLVSVYFTKVYEWLEERFIQIGGVFWKLMVGGLILGGLIFLFPSFYGEGYESINACLQGDLSYLFSNSLFVGLEDKLWVAIGLLSLIVLLKIVATSLTLGAGGIGGVFAPTLFMGVNTGMLFATLVNFSGIRELNSNNFALIGMAGLIAGVMHAPLTAIFLIADISGGYALFVPLMVTAAFAFLTAKSMIKDSIYHAQLARRKELFTHHRDQATLRMLKVKNLIERDFLPLSPKASLRDLTQAISISQRNIFPVVDAEDNFLGIIKMDDVRHLIFKPDLYDKVMISELICIPQYRISPSDSMETVAEKFQMSDKFNMPVIEDGKYCGFISRANVFSTYREKVKQFSHD